MEIAAFLGACTEGKDRSGQIHVEQVVPMQLLEELIRLALIQSGDGLTVLRIYEVMQRQGVVSYPQARVAQRRELDVSAADWHQRGVE